jgi:predicted nucleic acid-binding protein
MILLDSNIIIYAAKPEFAYLRPIISNPNHCISMFSTLEILGYPALTNKDKIFFESVFAVSDVKEISTEIIQEAIYLKQKKKMTNGDAIIAATALIHKIPIYTRNTADFSWIKGLLTVNPIK